MPLTEVMAAGGCTDGEAILSIDISLDGRELHCIDRGCGFRDGTGASHDADATEPLAGRSRCWG